MSQVPSELRYTTSHEWVRVETNGTVTIGITDYAQSLLGELVYVELPLIDQTVTRGAEVAVVESVKAASDVYAPIAGKIVAQNTALADDPGAVNRAPYTDGWLFALAPDNALDVNELLDSTAYQASVSAQEKE